MTLGEKANEYLNASKNSDDDYREPFKKFWVAEGENIRNIEVGTSADESNIKTVRSAVHSYVRSLDIDDRHLMRKAINEFFKKYVKEWQCDGSNRQLMCMMDKCMDSTERIIFLLKYLQGGEKPSAEVRRTLEDIAKELGISDNAAGSIWEPLEDGMNILGSDIKITRRSRRGNNYDNTVHPVFLALNLTEAFFLTEVLRRTFDTVTGENKKWQDVAADIAYDVHRQLSSYCASQMGRLRKHYYGNCGEVNYKKAPSGRPTKKGYRPERIDKEEVWPVEMLYKLGHCCGHVVEMKLKGEDEIYTGNVCYDEDKGIWYFICSDGRVINIPPAEMLERLREARTHRP